MKEFSTAATRGTPGVANPIDIEFMLDDSKLTAHAPTTGQIALFLSAGREGGLASVEAIFKFFSDILDDDDWKIIEDKLRDGMDVDLLPQISNFLVEEWSARPTSRSSASSPTRNGTGPQSTAKRQAAVRTTSRSRSTGSATSSNGG